MNREEGMKEKKDGMGLPKLRSEKNLIEIH